MFSAGQDVNFSSADDVDVALADAVCAAYLGPGLSAEDEVTLKICARQRSGSDDGAEGKDGNGRGDDGVELHGR